MDGHDAHGGKHWRWEIGDGGSVEAYGLMAPGRRTDALSHVQNVPGVKCAGCKGVNRG